METSLSSQKDGPSDGYEMDQAQPYEQRDRTESASSSHIGPMAVTVTVTEKAEALTDAVEGDKDEYPHGLPLLLIMISLCLSVLLVALDNTILVTAIPKITDAFKSLNDIGWYGSAYLLTTCSLQLFYGKLYVIFDIKFVFLAAISVFELGSLICGVAKNSITLIAGRAVAGAGAAGILSGAMIIIAHCVPLQKRPVYTGFTLGMYGIASVVGPLLGGVLTDRVSWRWCFYINLPIGAVVIALVGVFLSLPLQNDRDHSTPLRTRLMNLDPIGTAVFIPAIVCLLLALQLGGSTYPWSSGRIIAFFVVFGILFIAFIGIQIWRDESATVIPRIFMNRSVASGTWYGFFLGGSFFIFIYYLPTWFQAIQSTTATVSGVHLLPLSFSQMLGVMISGILTTRFGYYTPFMYLGVVFMSIGAGFLMTLQPDSSTQMWIGYQIIYGLGSGFGFQQPTIAAQAVLDLKDIPSGVALIMFTQLLGGAIFVSVGQNVFTNKLVYDTAKHLPGVNPLQIIQTGATELKYLVPPGQLAELLSVYNGALGQAFMVGTILAAMTVVGAVTMEWKSVKGKDPVATA
ncbi:hypothetical protein ACLOAV_000348 [Pseudogymnoascus australis]